MRTIVDLRQEHIAQISEKPLPYTIKGVTLVEDGKVLGVAGLHLGFCHYVLVSRITDELRARMRAGRCTRDMMRCAHMVIAQAKARTLPLYAQADTTIEGSERLLEHLGFNRIRGDVFEWTSPR